MPTVQESGPFQEVDLDKTDELPVLDLGSIDSSVKDVNSTARLDLNATTSDTDRHPNINLPALIESVQNAEARIAQQTALQEILERELKESRDRVEESRGEILRLTGETQALRATLAAREDTLAQAMHAVGDRDHQINELRRDHASLAQKLETNAAATAKLNADLSDTRVQIDRGRVELKIAQDSVGALQSQISRGDGALVAAQREADIFKRQATEFLENLRSREWQRSIREDGFREMDAKLAAALTDAAKFESEANSLAAKLDSVSAQLAEREASVRALESALAKASDGSKVQTLALQTSEQTRHELLSQLKANEAAQARHETEFAQLSETVTRHERSIAEERDAKAQLHVQVQSLESAQADNLSRIAELDRSLSEATHQKRLDDEQIQRHLAAIESLRAETATHLSRINHLEAELAATSALLDEVRRPIEAAEADIERLTGALEAKTRELEQSEGEAKKLQVALERSRGALQEREFLIRRLERSANNSAQVLGRLQSSIERLGAPAQPPAAAFESPAAEPFRATLIRSDNGLATTYALGVRTRVGRSPESDVRVDSSSVSRHHALIITGARHAIIEDLNSTNGVIVNGRKVSRHKLKDGDVLTIGEARFKYSDSGSLLPEANPVSFAPPERA
jgi:chromosome segregation ATPase